MRRTVSPLSQYPGVGLDLLHPHHIALGGGIACLGDGLVTCLALAIDGIRDALAGREAPGGAGVGADCCPRVLLDSGTRAQGHRCHHDSGQIRTGAAHGILASAALPDRQPPSELPVRGLTPAA